MDERAAAIDKQTQNLARARALVACCLLAALAWLAPALATAATTPYEAGRNYIHNFSPRSYGAGAQNWSLAQDGQGAIYVGNDDGTLLIWDSTRWQRITAPKHATVRSLARGADGRMYMGTVGDLGYLQPDATGQLAFVSLRDRIPPGERNFADVWATHVTADGVVFATTTTLFRYRGGAMETWKPPTSFHTSFVVDGRLYIRETGVGLMRLDGDKLVLVPGSGRFADERIYALLAWRGPGAQPGDLLAGTRNQGWFVLHGGTWRPWVIEADAAIRQGQLYDAIRLADGRLAVGTLRSGLLLLDAQGRLLRTLTRDSGLSSNAVLALMQDREGGLWVAEGYGIARIDIGSPLTIYDRISGLPGSVQALHRHAGTLYAGSIEGLYRLVAGTNPHFEEIPQVPGVIWGFAEIGDQMLVASDAGVFATAGGGFQQLLAPPQAELAAPALSLRQSTTDPSRVFVGRPDGVSTLKYEGSHWVDEGHIPGVRNQVRTIRQDAAGHVWLSLWGGGAIRLSLPPDWQGPRDPRLPKVERYGNEAGLPAEQNDIVAINGTLHFIAAHGIYRFDEGGNRFVPDAAFAGLFPHGPPQIDTLHQGHDGGLWMYAGAAAGSKEVRHAVPAAQGWRWQAVPLQPLTGTNISVFLDDADGTVWMGGDAGLFRYESTRAMPRDAQLATLLRRATGSDNRALSTDAPAAAGPPEIPWEQNSIRFEFALPSYTLSDATRYQVWLQGLDHGWSPWNDSTYRDYTNLPDGLYRFHVRARNVYGQQGREATFAFRILPPWYRTTWAWLLWIASATLLLGLLMQWRSATLRRRNRALATLVAQRTAELAQANEALQQANEALARQVMIDPLTGLKNRRYLSEHIGPDLASARRSHQHARQHGQPPMHLLFLMVDIDHFKRINDTWGHSSGDRVLQQFRDLLLSATRGADTPVRMGGEEFLIVARSAPADAGPLFAERIRATVAAARFDLGDGQHVQLTCSIGFANYPFFASELEKLHWEQVVNLADECLYAAKRQGRNAWVGVPPVTSPPPGNVVDALREALARLPGPGPLPVLASWVRNDPPEALK
ncbi:ligand-binding sensor domain-containing diguanylate cyclase [Rhodanobacter sp. DHB23]|uniref:ligand-binding sensor domain-containing diguanylate cyclase n=1 Tax=Rhodanobacter sp. DHB23 TaxID=2775923 RepID=UPI0017834D09|nr:ligand-binding sensor domain-containing diguanylate cyclase [Rhodanobacter sp. DHB23]MBD8873082.1 diguanylate cyclase [Rhodanobacter sp. DHB23]